MKADRALRTGAKLSEGRVFEVFELLEYPIALAGTRLVLKKIRPTLLQDEVFRNRLHKLLELLPRIHHPYAEEVLDAQAGDPEATYLVCERLEGETLDTLLRREGPLRLPAIRQLARQSVEALSAGHAQGIAHGNLTPSHIAITQSRLDGSRSPMRTKVCGFGLAPLIAEGLYGTPSYLAPEQVDPLMPNPQATPLSDQHALATLLYEALVGHPLFPRGDLEAVRTRLVRKDPPPFELRGVSPTEMRQVSYALQRALAKDPQARFPSLLEFVEALECKQAEPVQVFVPPPAPPSLPLLAAVTPPPAELQPATAPAPAAGNPAAAGPEAEPAQKQRLACESSPRAQAKLRGWRLYLTLLALLLAAACMLSLLAVHGISSAKRAPTSPGSGKGGVSPNSISANKGPLSKESDTGRPPPSEKGVALANLSKRVAAPANPGPTPSAPRHRGCRPELVNGNRPAVKKIQGCISALARELQGKTLTVRFAPLFQRFDIRISQTRSDVASRLELCLNDPELRDEIHDFSLFTGSGVIWSCRD